MKNRYPRPALLLLLSFSIDMLCSGCSATSRSKSPYATKTLELNSGLNEESQSEKVLSSFCDASYIAIQSTQDISSFEVTERYDEIKSYREKWKNLSTLNELTQASIISNSNSQATLEAFEAMEDQFPKNFPEEIIAELTKTALVNHKTASEVAGRFKDIRALRKWGSLAAISELTKASLFGQKSVDSVRTSYEDFQRRQGKDAKEMELVELTKAAQLSGRTPHEIISAFDQIETRNQGFVNRIRVAELTRIAMMTGASPKMVFYRFAELSMKKGEEYSTAKILELTKYSLLSRKTANELIAVFDRATKTQKNMSFSLFSGEILQDSTFGANVDECNGAHARLLLSVDTYRGG
jgi:hypothetical protein